VLDFHAVCLEGLSRGVVSIGPQQAAHKVKQDTSILRAVRGHEFIHDDSIIIVGVADDLSAVVGRGDVRQFVQDDPPLAGEAREVDNVALPIR
jgi:hypothetical protein